MDRPTRVLRLLLLFVAAFHLLMGAGLVFSSSFQRASAVLYGAEFVWTEQAVYFTRIIGSFVVIFGFLALMAARDPLRNQAIIMGFIGLFVLRSFSRHLHSDDLYAGFGISPLINVLTSAFFVVQAAILGLLLWLARRKESMTRG